jgi:2,4-dienoyl-CoA reductase-like NADH-dependent reductase (Old Yellow Enzyme family)
MERRADPPSHHLPGGAGTPGRVRGAVRREGGGPTWAVGSITDPRQADDIIIRAGQADVVLLARELLRNPRWPLLAAHRLGVRADWPNPYQRARPADAGRANRHRLGRRSSLSSTRNLSVHHPLEGEYAHNSSCNADHHFLC